MKIGFIGTGNMGSAILQGALTSGFLAACDAMVYDVNQLSMQSIQAEYQVASASSNAALAAVCEWVVLAVKPIYVRIVLDEIRAHLQPGAKLLSIAAGWSMEMLCDVLNRKDVHIVRVMPNTPALVGAGYTVLCEESTITQEDTTWVMNLFGTLGMAKRMPERLMDAVIAVSGSSPAYVYMFIEAMADAAVKQGMPRSTAIEAAAQAVLGAAKMVLETGEHPAVLKDRVCSPGGTTIAAVQTLEEGGMRAAVMKAMEMCAIRSNELTNESAGGLKK